MQKVFGFGFGVNPSKKPLSRSSKHECHQQSKLPNDHFSRCFQHRTWCGLISSSGWWTALPSVLCIKISQWHRETLCHSWKRSPCNNKGWWEVLWLRAQHPFHPRNWSQTTYCTPEYIRTLKDAPPISFLSTRDLWDTTIKSNMYQENIKSLQIHSHVLLLACPG